MTDEELFARYMNSVLQGLLSGGHGGDSTKLVEYASRVARQCLDAHHARDTRVENIENLAVDHDWDPSTSELTADEHIASVLAYHERNNRANLLILRDLQDFAADRSDSFLRIKIKTLINKYRG